MSRPTASELSAAAENMTTHDLAMRYGVTRETINSWCRSLDVAPPMSCRKCGQLMRGEDRLRRSHADCRDERIDNKRSDLIREYRDATFARPWVSGQRGKWFGDFDET